MPTAYELELSLYGIAPREMAADWDNVGLLVGDPVQQVHKVLVSLDITQEVADEAIKLGCDCIAAHHPVMNCRWLQVQTLREDTPQGKLLRSLVRADIACICMHTNLDVAPGGVNDLLASLLRLEDPGPFTDVGIGRIGTLPEPMALEDYARMIKKTLRCNGLRWSDGGRKVQRVAVGGGSCSSEWREALARGCDTFVTSDVTYHTFLDAAAAGLNLIDAGHFPTEDPVCGVIMDRLKSEFPALTVIKSAVHCEQIQYCD